MPVTPEPNKTSPAEANKRRVFFVSAVRNPNTLRDQEQNKRVYIEKDEIFLIALDLQHLNPLKYNQISQVKSSFPWSF